MTDEAEVRATRERFQAATSQCVFRIHNRERPLVDQLHSHAASLAYDLYDPSADPTNSTPLELLSTGSFVVDLAQQVLQNLVDRARDEGHTWEQIGAQMRITKQAAQQRFGRKK